MEGWPYIVRLYIVILSVSGQSQGFIKQLNHRNLLYGLKVGATLFLSGSFQFLGFALQQRSMPVCVRSFSSGTQDPVQNPPPVELYWLRPRPHTENGHPGIEVGAISAPWH